MDNKIKEAIVLLVNNGYIVEKKIDNVKKHKGIYFQKYANKYNTSIYHNNKKIYVGLYDNLELALLMQRRKIEELKIEVNYNDIINDDLESTTQFEVDVNCSPEEEFIKQYDFNGFTDFYGEKTPNNLSTTTYENYIVFCKENGYTIRSKKLLGSKIKNLGYKTRKSNSKRYYVYN